MRIASIANLAALALIVFVSNYVQPSYSQNLALKAFNTRLPITKKDVMAQAEGEVDRLLQKMKKDNELVIGRCLEVKPCKSIKRQVIPGQVIKGKVEEGKIEYRPELSYPPVARAARVSGSVVVQVIIDEKGKVIAAQVVSGHPLLTAASLKAARGTESKPTLLGGKPVKTMGTITYTFRLSETVSK